MHTHTGLQIPFYLFYPSPNNQSFEAKNCVSNVLIIKSIISNDVMLIYNLLIVTFD